MKKPNDSCDRWALGLLLVRCCRMRAAYGEAAKHTLPTCCEGVYSAKPNGGGWLFALLILLSENRQPHLGGDGSAEHLDFQEGQALTPVDGFDQALVLHQWA